MGGYLPEHIHKTWTTTLLGREFKSARSWSMLGMRLLLGFMFLWGGIEKIQTELSGKMATTGFLAHAVTGPYAGFFNGLAGNWAVEYLVVYGELAIGISLMFGLFTRVGGLSGIAMSLLFYFSQLPVQNNPFVNEYVIYALAFLIVASFAAGRFLGVDGVLQAASEKQPRLNRFLRALG